MPLDDRQAALGIAAERRLAGHADSSSSAGGSYRLSTHQRHDLLLVSGGHHASGARPPEFLGCYQALEEWARRKWPQAGDLLHAWSMQVGQQ